MWLIRCGGLPSAADITNMSEDVSAQGIAEVDAVFDDHEQNLDEGLDQFEAVADQNVGVIGEMIQSFMPQPAACSMYVLSFPVLGDMALDCELLNGFKAIYGWFLTLATFLYVWLLAIKPVNR